MPKNDHTSKKTGEFPPEVALFLLWDSRYRQPEIRNRHKHRQCLYDENCYYFFGTKGSIAFPSFNVYTYEEDQYGWEHKLAVEQIDVEENDPMNAELLHFVDVLRGQMEPLVSGIDSLETFKVVNAIKKSAETGQKVYINQRINALTSPASGSVK
ncbi:hypothetical protein PP175_17890 [Aneurinibacillus sp. Ricciae_BoGa-3]|uniref:hypothetical protein n=1 Tax=Aneurinibacillus sp. Ricciae_BoGa-3 TaxID=3022697 RepID=UPI002341CAB5|nr:hypothetical protein [Aneurinibacillus sp. Ricciae_BoGa-3]WCK53260.1 hypothetical protein PP175_17890 [Aneurinibacillus sp. Ricciae_BoGa-3]